MFLVKVSIKKLSPYILSIGLTTLFFILWLNIPYSIQTDAAHQIKSIQQWLNGIATIPNSLVVPDPSDLSKDIQIWIAWWPPGISIFFTPLIAAGFSLGLAARLTSYLLVLVGCCGWIKVADLFQAHSFTKVALASILPLYAMGSSTHAIYTLTTGDVIPLAIMPWLVVYTIYIILKLENREFTQNRAGNLHLTLVSFLLGSVYWLKYSAFLASLGLFLFLIVTYLKYQLKFQSFSVRHYFLTALLPVFFLIPLLILTVLNQKLSGSEIAVQQFESAGFNSFGVRGIGIILTMLGTLGLAMFQSADWLNSLVNNNPLFQVVVFDDPNQQKELMSLLVGVPGTLLTLWLIWRTRKLYHKILLQLCLFTTVIPLLGLLYLSVKVKFNFLADPITRYSSAFIVPLEILFISSCFAVVFGSHDLRLGYTTPPRMPLKIVVSIIFAFIFILPNAFILDSFFHFYSSRIASSSTYVTTTNQLFQPSLSSRNPRRIVNQIHSLITSPNDVFVIAPSDVPNYAERWLELNQRTLPLSLHGPLNVLANKANQELRTSQDLRVIIIASEADLKTQQQFAQLTGRFPQATTWTNVELPRHSRVSVWFSDIKASS